MNKANQGKKILERIWKVWEAGMIKVTMTTHSRKMGKKRKENRKKKNEKEKKERESGRSF
jgi:hypothetical protein